MATSKQVLDSLLEANSAATVAEILDVNRGNIHHYIHRYNRKKVPKILHDAWVERELVTVKKRIRSQITWESKEQKENFINYIRRKNYDTITKYCREQADAFAEDRLIIGVEPIIWQHTGFMAPLTPYPIDTGEDL